MSLGIPDYPANLGILGIPARHREDLGILGIPDCLVILVLPQFRLSLDYLAIQSTRSHLENLESLALQLIPPLLEVLGNLGDLGILASLEHPLRLANPEIPARHQEDLGILENPVHLESQLNLEIPANPSFLSRLGNLDDLGIPAHLAIPWFQLSLGNLGCPALR